LQDRLQPDTLIERAAQRRLRQLQCHERTLWAEPTGLRFERRHVHSVAVPRVTTHGDAVLSMSDQVGSFAGLTPTMAYRLRSAAI
jgi:hypothetical protein